MGLKILFKKVYSIIKNDGIDSLGAKIVYNSSKNDVLNFYDYIVQGNNENEKKIEKEIESVDNKDEIFINWIIPEMGVGSGGHINIFRFVSYLQLNGFKNRIYLFKSSRFRNNESLKKFLMIHYPKLNSTVEVNCNCENVKFSHCIFATSWQTAYFVKQFEKTEHKFYFIQDFEPDFYPKGSEYYWAEDTYKFDFIGITAGRWLSEKISKEYGMKCYYFDFSYDKKIYKPIKKRDKLKRVLFYSRPVTPRRMFETGLIALNELYKKMPVEIIFVGWDVSNYDIPFPHLNAGSIPIDELPDLYSQCDICMVLSATNVSLLPLEIMACKSAVMSNYGENLKWLLNENISILTGFNPLDIYEKLYYYLNHEEELNAIKENGYNFAIKTDWDRECQNVKKIILKEIL